MAGQPQKRAIIAALEKRTRETFEDDADATHLDYVEHWQASGQTLNALGVAIGLGEKKGESISRYLHRVYGNVASERLSRARARGAHSLVEESLEIADSASEDDVAVARLRVQARQWTAEKWNAAEFANKGAAVNVSMSFGVLHLQALQKLQLPSPADAAPAEVGEILTLPASS